ncbi:MAG: hypothetical protein KatS3mg093_429 [Candidatus Parcubacteria bacterium]|nr:MAG: hypothetical protein KatS3mg001_528 [Candidatus Pacearchaeota archaeon]GIW65450.1 MAG: hypothetical protein KatS3mg093_429 [Candidatus Parcubacteria bacterium]
MNIRNFKGKFRKALGVAAISLALNSPLYSQQKNEEVKTDRRENTVYVDESCTKNSSLTFSNNFSTAGDGIFLKGFVSEIELERKSRIELDDYFCLRAKEGPVMYGFLDIKKGLENVISYLKKEKSLNKRDNYFLDYLTRLSKTSEGNDSLSLYLLNKAVNDNVIDSEKDSLFDRETAKIVPGMYMIIARSSSTKGLQENSVPIILRISPNEFGVKEEIESEWQKKKITRRDVKRVGFGLDGFLGEEGFVGANFLFGYHPIKFSFSYSKRDDKLVDSLYVPLSAGRVGIGKREEIEFSGVGAGLEFSPLDYFFVGAGLNNWNFTENVEEGIFQNGKPVKLSQNSKSRRKLSQRFYAGIGIPINSFVIRSFVGYDNISRWYAGLGFYLKLK